MAKVAPGKRQQESWGGCLGLQAARDSMQQAAQFFFAFGPMPKFTSAVEGGDVSTDHVSGAQTGSGPDTKASDCGPPACCAKFKTASPTAAKWNIYWTAVVVAKGLGKHLTLHFKYKGANNATLLPRKRVYGMTDKGLKSASGQFFIKGVGDSVLFYEGPLKYKIFHSSNWTEKLAACIACVI